MFDILEADIVVFQETKIQRKDLTDDMVLVPGWDCYFSLPRHKKGYIAAYVACGALTSRYRLFRHCHIHSAICLCTHPRRRRHYWQSLSTKLISKLL